MRARLTPTLSAERLPGRMPYRDALEALAQRIQALPVSREGGRRDICRVEVELEPFSVPMSAIDWLGMVPAGRRMHFRSRDGATALSGIGWALHTHDWSHPAIASLVASGSSGGPRTDDSGPGEPELLALEPFDASGRPDERWRDFETAQIVLPAVTFSAGAGPILAAHSVSGSAATLETIAQLVRAAQGGCAPSHGQDAQWTLRDDGDPARWADAIDGALDAISAGRLEKVVLARTRTYGCDRQIDPVDLLRRMSREEPDAFHLLFESGVHRAFVAASPERLFLRSGRTVRSEAVAGTCARGPDAPSDERLAERLLSSDKNRREHDIVTRRIESALRPISSEVRAAASPEVVRLAHVQHLSTPICAELRDGVDDGTILARLHPTPAVCGLPASEARAFIAAHEGASRGMYAGAVGIVGATRSEFAVGIRCALVDGDLLIAFAGAGIVPGSEADAEWLETARKLESIDAALRPASAVARGAAQPQQAQGGRRQVAATRAS